MNEILDPSFFLNPPIDRNSLERILYPIRPRNLYLYYSALTHTSVRVLSNQYPEYTKHPFYISGHPIYGHDYEKLEFLGDSIIHASLAMILIRLYPNKDEGFLSRVRINIERKSGLASLCQQIGLSGYIKKHPEIPLTESVMENVFEGFIGALFEDQQIFLYNGLQRCNGFIGKTLENILHNIRNDDNYKDTILRLYDKHVFENIEFKCSSNHEERLHTVTLTCSYIPARIQYIVENGYAIQDLGNIMLSIPNVNSIQEQIIRRTGKNKRETEQETSKILMEILRIRMNRI
jgi:dsRNA-specific ribonuclease